MNGKKLSKAEREDLHKHFLSVQKNLLRRLQDCIRPEHALRVAIKRLRVANEKVDQALSRLDRLATDQANYAQLKVEAMEITLLLGLLEGCDSEAEVNTRRKQIRFTLERGE